MAITDNDAVAKQVSAEGPREVITDPNAAYFGITPGERTLLPGDDAHIADNRFEDWLKRPTSAK